MWHTNVQYVPHDFWCIVLLIFRMVHMVNSDQLTTHKICLVRIIMSDQFVIGAYGINTCIQILVQMWKSTRIWWLEVELCFPFECNNCFDICTCVFTYQLNQSSLNDSLITFGMHTSMFSRSFFMPTFPCRHNTTPKHQVLKSSIWNKKTIFKQKVHSALVRSF